MMFATVVLAFFTIGVTLGLIVGSTKSTNSEKEETTQSKSKHSLLSKLRKRSSRSHSTRNNRKTQNNPLKESIHQQKEFTSIDPSPLKSGDSIPLIQTQQTSKTFAHTLQIKDFAENTLTSDQRRFREPAKNTKYPTGEKKHLLDTKSGAS